MTFKKHTVLFKASIYFKSLNVAQLKSSPQIVASFYKITADLSNNWSGDVHSTHFSFISTISATWRPLRRDNESLWCYNEVYDWLHFDKTLRDHTYKSTNYVHCGFYWLQQHLQELDETVLVSVPLEQTEISQQLLYFVLMFNAFVQYCSNYKSNGCLVLLRKCWLANMAQPSHDFLKFYPQYVYSYLSEIWILHSKLTSKSYDLNKTRAIQCEPLSPPIKCIWDEDRFIIKWHVICGSSFVRLLEERCMNLKQ